MELDGSKRVGGLRLRLNPPHGGGRTPAGTRERRDAAAEPPRPSARSRRGVEALYGDGRPSFSAHHGNTGLSAIVRVSRSAGPVRFLGGVVRAATFWRRYDGLIL